MKAISIMGMLLLTLFLAPFFTQLSAEETGGTPATKSATAAPGFSYRPPARGAPASRVGGGSRGSDFEKASTLFKESLILSNESGNDINIALALTGLAGVLGMTGEPEQAAQLLGAADLIIESLGQLEPADQKDFDYYLSVVRKQLKKPAFEKAWASGRAMTMEQAVECALEQTGE